MEATREPKENILDHPKRILVGGAVIGIGGFILYKIIKKAIDEKNKKDTEKQAADSPEVRQAMNLRSAINPSGISWMKSFDTTNVKAVFDAAAQVKKLDEVIKAYQNLYGDDLMRDLQNELSASDYQKVLTMVSSNPQKTGGAAPVRFAAKSQLIVAKREVFLRSSPDASYHGAIYELTAAKNILKKAKAGEFIGYATGRQQFDAKNNVKFIEAGYLIKKEDLPASLKSQAGKRFVWWVSSSSEYVDIFPFYKDMWTRYPATQNEVSYKKPLDYYGKVAGIAGMTARPVVTIRSARVLDEQFQKPIPVQSGTLLGSYLATLDTGKGIYIKFRTIDRTERWVKASEVILNS